jgi:hypothetical protein
MSFTYTNDVPQANQTIASSQPQIQDNFGFIESSLQQDHEFNEAFATEGVHKQASMPNRADPGSLAAGTDGMYYVGSGLPKFFNGVVNFLSFATVPNKILTGTAALTTSASTVLALPASSCGIYWIFRTTNVSAYAMGMFVTSGTAIGIEHITDPNISISESGLNLRAETTSATFNGSYSYVVIYVTP